MNNEDYEQLEEEQVENSEESEELADDSTEEVVEENQPNDLLYNRQNLQNSLRKNQNQNAINRIKQRQVNTYSKKVESNNSTSSDEQENDENNEQNEKTEKQEKKGGLKDKFNPKEKLKNAAKQKGADIGKAVKNGIKKLATSPATAPYFWGIIGIFALIIMIPVFIAAINGGGSDDSGSGGKSGTISYAAGYEKCKSITLTKGGSVYKTLPFEDYIAGVVAAESGANEEWEEALKAQAVVARGIALNITNNCTGTMPIDENRQAYKEATDYTKKIAQETEGQILVDKDGNRIDTYFAAYPMDGYNGGWMPETCSVTCATDTCTTTIYKPPNNKPYTFTMPRRQKNGEYWNFMDLNEQLGHCMGYSQVGGYYYSSIGEDYKTILKHFNDFDHIATISERAAADSSSPTLTGEFVNGFQIRTTVPDIYNSDSNYYTYGGNYFHCVWYAVRRVKEILGTMKGANATKVQEAMSYIDNSGADGSGWYAIAQSGSDMTHFKSSNNVNYPRPGSLISWKWNDAGCRDYTSEGAGTCVEYGGWKTNYGHVAVIESVDEKNKTVTLSEAGRHCSNWNDLSCLWFNYQTVSFDELKLYRGQLIFQGYVYVADYVKGGK